MAGPRLNPTIIDLKELPEDGRHFSFTRLSGELNETLSDLIGGKEYEFDIQLKPLGNAFEISGFFKTGMDLVCSRCAIEFSQNLNENFREIIVINEDIPRSGKYSKPNHASEFFESGPFCNYLETNKFDIASYAHEMIAAAEPLRPLGGKDCEIQCDNYDTAVKEGWVSLESTLEKAPTPFSALKDFKVKAKH